MMEDVQMSDGMIAHAMAQKALAMERCDNIATADEALQSLTNNIAIAEACGWTLDLKGAIRVDGYRIEVLGKRPHEALPDYLNCLNAMHEAEKVLTENQRIAYSDHTYDIACEEQDTTGKWRWLSLTATQRAEAFLRTIGKWGETQ